MPPLVHDTPLSLLPQDLLDLTYLLLHFAGYTPARYHGNAYSRPSRPCDWPAYFTIRLFFTEVTPLTLLVISPAFLTAS
jgi:hypothetical protein